MCLIPGILGFIACCIFDVNKIQWHLKSLNCFFTIGSLLIALSTVWGISQSDFSSLIENFSLYHIGSLIGCILSGIALIYILFFALPFDDTYIKNTTLPLVDHGVYALCRHPGFWVFTLFYLFLGLFLSNPVLLVASLLYTGCNFFYICLQDHYIFPLYIRGYKEYKKNVPFLLPTRKSIRKALGQYGLHK